MKKFLIIAIIGLVLIVGLFENTGEDIPEEAEADAKTEETSDKDDNKSQSETTDKDKEEAERKHEEQKAEEQAAKEEQEAKEKAEEEEKEAQAKAEEEKQRKENEAKEKADSEQIYLQIMNENVGSYVNIQFDKANKTYTMTPIDQGLIDEISMLPMGIGHEDWGVLVDGMTSMSKSGKDLVGEGYSINLVNPSNHENIILWIMDGEVIYNVIDDL